eukprot:5090920-Prymnesium_polylepis.1
MPFVLRRIHPAPSPTCVLAFPTGFDRRRELLPVTSGVCPIAAPIAAPHTAAAVRMTSFPGPQRA